jgi:hypothetical protein
MTDEDIHATAKYYYWQAYCGDVPNAAPVSMQRPKFPDKLGLMTVRFRFKMHPVVSTWPGEIIVVLGHAFHPFPVLLLGLLPVTLTPSRFRVFVLQP